MREIHKEKLERLGSQTATSAARCLTRAVRWFAIGSASLACSSPEVLGVGSRLGDPDAQPDPVVKGRLVSIDKQLRRAHCVEAGGEFRVVASPGVRRVLLEIGVKDGPASVQFSIRQGEAVIGLREFKLDFGAYRAPGLRFELLEILDEYLEFAVLPR